MTKVDHVFHSLEVLGIEVMFKPNLVILNFVTGVVREFKVSDFGRLENVAKFIAHDQGVKYHAKRI